MTTWCRFEKDNVTSYGMVEGGQVIAVDGSPFGDHKKTARAYPLASVKLLIPVVPPTFYCVGINYADHIRKMAAKRSTEPVFPQAAGHRLPRQQRADRARGKYRQAGRQRRGVPVRG